MHKRLNEAFFEMVKTTYNLPTKKTDDDVIRTLLPGITYTMLLRTGLPDPVELLKMCDQTRVLSVLYPERYQIIPNLKGVTSVLTSQRFTINRAFYTRQAFHWPMEMTVRQVSYSAKSTAILIALVDQADGEVLLQTRRQIALVGPDNQTLETPPALRDQFRRLRLPMESIRMAMHLPPTRHFQWRMRVRHSDTDFLNHANQSAYLAYSLEAAAHARSQGAFSDFAVDLYSYRLQEAEIRYMQESFAGDELIVKVWRDDKPLSIRSHITRGDQPACHCKLTFYPLANAKL